MIGQMIGFVRDRLRRLALGREGASAIEFAFVAPVLILFVVGAMEVATIAHGSTLLNGGLREASRFGMTGLQPATGTREDRIAEIINRHGAGIIKVGAGNITTHVYPNFTSIGQPEPYVDTDSNGVYDIGEPFTDVNCNAVWDPDMGQAGLGAGGEVVLYRVNYDLPLRTGLLAAVIGKDGKVPLSATVALRNEPFKGSSAAC